MKIDINTNNLSYHPRHYCDEVASLYIIVIVNSVIVLEFAECQEVCNHTQLIVHMLPLVTIVRPNKINSLFPVT